MPQGDRVANDPTSSSTPESPGVTSLAGEVISGTRWTGLSQVAMQGTRLIVQVILARLLAPEDFGAIAVALVVVHLLDIVMDLGTGPAIIQRRELAPSLASAIFVLNAVLGAILCLTLILTADFVAGLFGTPDARPVLQVMAFALIITSLARTQQAMLRRNLKFRAVAMVGIGGSLASAFVAIPAALLGAGVWALVAGHLAMATAMAVIAYRSSGWLPSRPFDFRGLREIADYSLNVSGTQFIEFFLQSADKVVIGRFLGVVPLGVYAIAERFMRYPVYALARVLMGVLFPTLSRTQEDPAALRRAVLRSGGAMALIVLPMMVGLASIAEEFTHVVLGDRWSEVVPLLQILAPAGAIQALVMGCSTVFLATGRADLQFRLGLLTGIAYLVSYLVGVQWGLPGLAIAFGVAVVVMAVPGLILPLRLIDLRLRDFLRELRPYVFSTAIMSLAVIMMSRVLSEIGGSSLVVLVSGVATGVVVYGGAILLLRPPALGDVLALTGLQHKLSFLVKPPRKVV